ncbi:sulfur carrier protein ThiS [Acanthopleuribacter pedis]|uniref:Sulfur carrier protein ThiS n=1 Tax=Acanthopleuribacter pedis TaxID=442870 RepID=A0A8J7U1U8_9BACT|nr:sulfur carrier protein ThiS [Acanthopleuribacter pedis]MBO1317054.1 sulfur carrier protein ThiS [Acanthopleuribacter pedis]
MIELTLNGEAGQLAKPMRLDEFLADRGFHGRGFAVALDGDFVPRSRYADVTLRGGESLEVLSPMQGG